MKGVELVTFEPFKSYLDTKLSTMFETQLVSFKNYLRALYFWHDRNNADTDSATSSMVKADAN
jgi:hypothetical protein